MSATEGLALRGFLADAETGAGLGGLRVELRSPGGSGAGLIAACQSDDAGVFRVRVPARWLAARGSRTADVEWKVVDRGHVVLQEIRPLPAGGPRETVILTVPSAAEEEEPEGGVPTLHEVVGRVKGTVPQRAAARLVLKTLRNQVLEEETVAEEPVNAAGWYRLTYESSARPGEPADTTVAVRLHAGNGELVGESMPVPAGQRRLRLDVRPARRVAGPCEYALLEERVAEGLECGPTGLDGAEADVLVEVSDWLDLDAERLAMFQEARALSTETGIPAAAFYALARNGTGPALEGLLDVSTAELRTTLQEAAADGIVDPASLGDLEPVVEQLSAAVIAHKMRADAGTPVHPGLVEVLAAADIAPDAIEHVLRRYQARTGTAAEFWESFPGADEGGGEEVEDAGEIELAVGLGSVVGADPPLLREMHERRREGRWQRLEDLADLDFDDWCDLLEEIEAQEREAAGASDAGEGLEVAGEDGVEDGAGEEGETEEEARERIEARAEAILDILEEAYPSRFIQRRLAESEEVTPAARALLARVPRHDFHNESIRDRVAAEPALIEGLDPGEVDGALDEVEAVERVSRVTDRAEEVAVLLATGLRSSMAIASMPRRQFITLYDEALGGRAQAARVHAQAQQAAAGVKFTALRLLQSMQHVPFVLGSRQPAIKDVPDARTLFQAAGGFCDCEHCGSVYSPAAYFVDLLRYLNVSSPDRLEQLQKRRFKDEQTAAAVREKLRRFQPLEVLLGRRPDLADLPLTCENTLTPLPYIDLVNEVLEAAVTGGSAAFDTGKTQADVLRAVPQNVSRDAYERLREAVHPLTLPYHQPLALARAYLAHLGVTRLELLRALGRAERAPDALVAESLGMSPEEFSLVVQPPAEPWRQLEPAGPGSGGASLPAALERVPALLAATGLTFQDVIALVSTRFLNGDNRLQLETPSPDCNPETVRLAGLDNERLARMVRVIRLQRRLGWPFADLDRALAALGAVDLDAAVLERLATAREVARRLDRPLPEILVLWAPIDTIGKDNQFEKLFASRAVAWRTQDARTFQLRADRAELAETGGSLDPVASALLAGFRITSEELSRIRTMQARRGSPPGLDLAGLSSIYRVVVLARALQLRIPALDLLLRLTPPEANPFRPADPAATLRFIEIVREVQASDFTPERLAYLFRHESEPRRDPGPLQAQVEAVLASIRRGLADAFSETTRPTAPTGEMLRQKLAVLFDAVLIDPALEVLDPRTSLTTARRQEFFNRHLARLFPDAAAAASALFGVAAPAPVPAPASSIAAATSAPPAGAAAAALPPPAPSVPIASAPEPPPEPPGAGEAAATTPAPPPASPMERRWQANIDFVLEHLLPVLRVRQLRGAIIQALSDTLGVSVASTARLLEVVLRSRSRPGQPLLADFLAMLGSGLTGAYYANPDLAGQPAASRVDPELAFSWAGAPPAPGVPGSGFSARWTGHMLPRGSAPHSFYVQTDGAVRLSLTLDGRERVLIDQPAAPGGRAVEHASEPIALDPARLVAIRLEYRNTGGTAALSLQQGTGPAAKQPVPTPNLYPADGLSSFEPVERSYRRLHKAASIASGFGMTDAQLEWLTTDPPYLDLDGLPSEPVGEAEGVALFHRWRQLARLYSLRRTLPRSNADLFDVFRAATLTEAIDRLVLATGWERSVVEGFLGRMGVDSAAALRPPLEAGREPLILRLARAVEVQRRVGVAPATLYGWADTMPDADGAAAIVQAVKARYDETRWLEVARSLNDPLRAERRDALVAYLLPRMRALGIRNRGQLFEYFLIDVDMNPCMLTSRIRQATGAVQTFFQRCLMNLEPKVPPRVIDDKDWKWLKNYRVWEANRKVFLYPENWIEPELRDDKSPLFQVLESAILQQEIKRENVEAAFADYLEGLDEIGRLDVRGVWFEKREEHRMVRQVPSALRTPPPPRSDWATGTYHVFARTFNAPHVWYYRRLESGRTWTPWEKIDADIEGDHLLPMVFNNRMHLFWAIFREVTKKVPEMKREEKGPPPAMGKDWEIHLAYSVYDRGRWSRKRMSSGGVVDEQAYMTVPGDQNKSPQHDGSRDRLSPSDYTLRARVAPGDPPRLQVHLYCRAVDRVDALQLRLTDAAVEHLAVFDLNGCNGALVPDRRKATERATIVQTQRTRRGLLRRSTIHGAIGNVRTRGGAMHPFRLADGGTLNAPKGYAVSAMSFNGSRSGGPLLTFPPTDASGLEVALRAGGDRRGAAIVPVVNPEDPERRGLFPFFFQDRFRSYFVRPVYADWHPPKLVAMPVFARPAFVRPALPPPRPARRPRRRRRGRGGREDIDESMLVFDAQDAWEDFQDEAWHPDDAAEARRPRQRRRPARPRRAAPARQPARPALRRGAAAPAVVRPKVVMRQQAEYHEQRLQFVPFEHPHTCRLLSTLKAKGIEGLLDFVTTRPAQGVDHVMRRGESWQLRRPTWFERHYGIGPLVYDRKLPHLDVAFEADSPYGSYNWELFFHAPLQVAIRLAKDGRHEEAQRWFHFIFDPTTDSSAPSPKRYWRFAPFYENDEYESARDLMHLLSYTGRDGRILERQQQVRNQLSAWWEKPFSPHVIARLRTAAYQKAVVMKYIDNLVEWGDKLFRRDSMESIQEATQIYILAANILGPRPEKIPAIVSKPPLTFQRMRHALDLFSNFEVRLENLQVRRPFRVNARPDAGGASALLGMATQYFCTPPNPQLDKYWDTVADRLFKIRNCMNIQGVVRQLPLFEPPIDPGLLVRAAAAGVDLGSVIASLNAPPPNYRFRFLLARATRLAEEIRTFGRMTLEVLERRDAEGLASLRASNETLLLDAVRDIRKKQVRQVEEALAELSLERENIDIKAQHLAAQVQQLMNPQEEAQQKSLSAAQVISGITEGVDLVGRVLHAIPEIQTGAAGAFSSPFATVQLGGQMFGDAVGALSASLEKVMAKNETEAQLAAQQAEYQRRREEWQHELEVLAKEKAQAEKRIAETQLKLEITSAELRRHDLEVETARKVQTYLRDKYTNEQLYGWMLGQLSSVYFQAYKVAFDAAQQAERAFRFERGDSSSSFIEFSYWDSLKKGLFAGERLVVDLRRMEAAYLEGDRRALEITRHVSLRDDFPLALLELIGTGRCRLDVTEPLLDGDFPGHYFRRIKSVSLTVSGVAAPNRNVNCTLTLLENRIRTDANASGSYAPSPDGEDSRFTVNPVPVQAVATSRPDADAGVFHLRFEDDRYLPFEGAGAISSWRIELPQADNSVDLSAIADVVLTLSYTARSGGAALEAAARAERDKGLARGGLRPEPLHAISVRREVPAAWKRLEEAAPGQEVEIPLPLDAGRLPGRYRGLDVRVDRATIFAHARAALAAGALRARLDPPKGSGAPIPGWTPSWPRTRTVRGTAEVSGPPGTWKLAASASGAKVSDLVDDLVLVFELRARKTQS